MSWLLFLSVVKTARTIVQLIHYNYYPLASLTIPLPFRVLLLYCCLRATISIVIVGSRSGCSCCGVRTVAGTRLSDCVPVVVVAAVREGRHGDKDFGRGCVDIVVDNKRLLRETNKQTRVRL